MGWGDEVMVTGEAVRLGCSPTKPLIVLGKDGKPRWHMLWNNNPRFMPPSVIATDREYVTIRNHPGWRPYVVYASDEYRAGIANQTDDLTVTNKSQWLFHPTWRATPGELCSVGIRAPGGYVVVEPHGKAGLSGNKDWPFKSWQALADILKADGFDVVQLGSGGGRVLDGVHHIPTRSFEIACTALSGAVGAILPEGGLHHAAAALNIPAVVLFGGATSPFNTGYDGHINIADDGEQSPCGMRQPCRHCAESWRRLKPEFVAITFTGWHRLRAEIKKQEGLT